MADITARLIWYRLGEVADNVRVYIMDEDVDVLDVLFAMWVLLAILILVIVYGLEWLTKTSLRVSGGGTSATDDHRWSQLKRRHSFFSMDEGQARALVHGDPRAEVIDATQEPNPAWRTNGSLASAREPPISAATASATSVSSSGQDTPDPHCLWMNRLIMWMYLNYSQTPEWLNAWLQSLNSDLERRSRGDKVRLEFVRLTPGSLPPKILTWSCEPGDDTRCLIFRTRIAISELGFVVRLVRLSESVKGGSCNVLMRNFFGEMHIATEMGVNLESMRLVMSFVSKPQMDVTATRPPDGPPVDLDWVKRHVVTALEQSSTEINFSEPRMTSRGDARGVDAVLAAAVAAGNSAVRSVPRVTIDEAPSISLDVERRRTASRSRSRGRSDAEEETVVASRSVRIEAAPDSPTKSSADEEVVIRARSSDSRARPSSNRPGSIPRFYSGQRTFGNRNSVANGSVNRPLLLSNSAAPPQQASGSLHTGDVSAAPPSPMRSPVTELAKGQSILTKVIKAAGLLPSGGHRAVRERGIYCLVEMDEPYQRHTTQVVRGTNTAFWDQSFVLELNTNSQRITFAVFDNDSQKDASLGQTIVPVRELMAHPSSRQIIPLRVDSKRRSKDSSSGAQPSITVEFLFLLPEKAPSPQIMPTRATVASSSPRNSVTTVEGALKKPGYVPQISASSSSTSATSSSSTSSDAVPQSRPQNERPGAATAEQKPAVVKSNSNQRVTPHAIVITSDENGQDDKTDGVKAVSSRDLANFMSPPDTTSCLPPQVPTASQDRHFADLSGSREEPAVLVYRDVRDPIHVAMTELSRHQSSGSGYSPGTIIIQNYSRPARAERPPTHDSEEAITHIGHEPPPAMRGRSARPERAVTSKRSRSFASRLRRTFVPGSRAKERSQSADRLSNNSLRPPDPAQTNGASLVSSQSSLQKSKSSGLSGSFRRIFGGGGRKQKSQSGTGQDHDHAGTSGMGVHHSSPHLDPQSAYRMAGRQRPPPPKAQQPMDDHSSYSSEGYDLYNRHDSVV